MRWPRYGQMKASGVAWLGEVPGHWDVTKLKFVARLVYGDALPADERSDGAVSVMGSNGEVGVHESANTLAPTIIVGRKGSHGKVIYSDAACFAIDTAFYVDGRHCAAHLRWLYYLLGTLGLDQESKDSAVPGLAREDAHEKPVVAPPLDEQRAIAAFLDRETARIDALVAAKRRLIALLQEKRAALIARAVTRGLDPEVPTKDSGVAWLGRVPAHWDVMPLKRRVKWITSGSRGWAGHYSDDGDLFLRIGNLTRDSIHLDLADVQRVSAPAGAEGERTSAKAGDLVLSITAYLGSVAVVPAGLDSTYVSQHVALARPRQNLVDPRWLAFCILSSPGQRQLQAAGYGGTKVQLSLDDVLSVIITMPPIDEQRRICDQLEAKTDSLKAGAAEVERTIVRLIEYRSTLITSAVTGRIDVRAAA
jgi:type I restriction enzyme, S subunit